MKKYIIIAGLLIFLLPMSLKSQNYTWGVGLRLGSPFGVSFNKTTSAGALELIVGGLPYYNKFAGVSLTGLYEIYVTSGVSRSIDLYYGFGGHIGTFQSAFYGQENRVNLGPDGIIGASYELDRAPIAVTLDFKPGINIFNNFEFLPDLAFTIRYIVL